MIKNIEKQLKKLFHIDNIVDSFRLVEKRENYKGFVLKPNHIVVSENRVATVAEGVYPTLYKYNEGKWERESNNVIQSFPNMGYEESKQIIYFLNILKDLKYFIQNNPQIKKDIDEFRIHLKKGFVYIEPNDYGKNKAYIPTDVKNLYICLKGYDKGDYFKVFNLQFKWIDGFCTERAYYKKNENEYELIFA